MCSHYQAEREAARLERRFGIKLPAEPFKDDVWPKYESLFIRRPREADAGDEAVPAREAAVGHFGLVPHWARDLTICSKTYNSRSETSAKLPSFSDAWKKGWHCVIPVAGFYEPDWRSGKAVPTFISSADGEPLGIAGLWSWNNKIDGKERLSFTMLTVNATGHPLMQNFHRPDDEKRMVVILPADGYDAWLQAPADASMDFMRTYPAEKLVAVARPSKPRVKA